MGPESIKCGCLTVVLAFCLASGAIDQTGTWSAAARTTRTGPMASPGEIATPLMMRLGAT